MIADIDAQLGKIIAKKTKMAEDFIETFKETQELAERVQAEVKEMKSEARFVKLKIF